ncbi:MAG: CCA tRNA nucleotidyltransferase [Tissierellia bacterium]|nr:CCA tRNA nucleotidyltransferase [Tissierellia bacterium]
MEINMPDYVQLIINILEENNFEAYIVGGALRDILLDKEPKDYDIGTNALPEEIERIFCGFKPISVGKKFGTIVVPQKEGDIEVTTFRKDGDYIDGRRPEWVIYSNNIIEDLSRRDFTINAMAYSEKVGLIDPFRGKIDLEKQIIKTVGNPEERFQEDYLRILRAVRFSTELGFVIEENTFNAGKKYSKYISNISQERIREEFFKILVSDTPSQGIRILEEIGALKIILPELVETIDFHQKNPHHERDIYEHVLCVIDQVPAILNLRLAALFHDMGKVHTQRLDEEGIAHYYNHHKISGEICKTVLKRLKSPNELIDKTEILVLEHMNHHNEFGEKGLKRLINKLGKEEIFNLLELQKADIKCSNERATIDHIIGREKRIKEILENKEAISVKDLDINGRDLIEMGYREGEIIGQLLDYLLDRVLEEPELNEKKKLVGLLANFKL